MTSVMTCNDRLLLDIEDIFLLTAIEGKPRNPLENVARTLLDGFHQLTSNSQVVESFDPSDQSNLIYYYNMGALVQYHYGNFQLSEEICHHALSICGSMLEKGRSVQWANFILQPYINLGRIAAARGNISDGLKIFESFYRYFTDASDLEIEGVNLPASLIPQLLEYESTLRNIANTVYLNDSIRAYLFNEDHMGMEIFVDRLMSLPQYTNSHFKRKIVEAKAKCLFRLHRSQESLEVLASFLRGQSTDRWKDVGLYCIMSNIYTACGRPDEALKILALINRYAALLMKLPAHSAISAHTIYYASLTAFHAGDYQMALQHARNALEICQAIEHEAGLIKTLCLLLMIARQPGAHVTTDKHQEYYNRLLALAKSTGYWIEKSLACHELMMSTISAARFSYHQEISSLTSWLARMARKNQGQSLIHRRLLAAFAMCGDWDPRPAQCEESPILSHPLISELHLRLVSFVPE